MSSDLGILFHTDQGMSHSCPTPSLSQVQQSSFYGYTGMLPKRYTQGVMTGESEYQQAWGAGRRLPGVQEPLLGNLHDVPGRRLGSQLWARLAGDRDLCDVRGSCPAPVCGVHLCVCVRARVSPPYPPPFPPSPVPAESVPHLTAAVSERQRGPPQLAPPPSVSQTRFPKPTHHLPPAPAQ